MIRKAEIDDAAIIEQIRIDTWLTTYKGIISDHILNHLNDKKEHRIESLKVQLETTQMYVVLDHEQIVGYIGYGHGRDKWSANGDIFAIYILEAYQRRGYGKALMYTALTEMNEDKILIWVLEDNASCRVYEALGGKPKFQKMITIGGDELKEIGFEFIRTEFMKRTSSKLD